MTVTGNVGSADPKPRLAAALDQVQSRLGALGPEDLSRPTPCAEYDVRMLLAHLVAVLRKLTVVARGEDMSAVPDPAEDITDGWADEYRRARADLERAWSAAAALDETYTLPWGTMTGRELLDAYTHEFTVHAWDLARASGDVRDLDPVLAEQALDWFRRNVPAGGRSHDGPFAPVVEVGDDADAYTRLAGYVGRPVRG